MRPSALYGAEVIDMKGEEIDKLQNAENTAMRKILGAPKLAASSNKRIGICNMKSRIARNRLLYLRRIETGNNEVLKKILEDCKKNKKSKWWEITKKYMNCAQIEEREIKKKDSERNQTKNSKCSGGRMERRTGEEELLRDIQRWGKSSYVDDFKIKINSPK